MQATQVLEAFQDTRTCKHSVFASHQLFLVAQTLSSREDGVDVKHVKHKAGCSDGNVRVEAQQLLTVFDSDAWLSAGEEPGASQRHKVAARLKVMQCKLEEQKHRSTACQEAKQSVNYTLR